MLVNVTITEVHGMVESIEEGLYHVIIMRRCQMATVAWMYDNLAIVLNVGKINHHSHAWNCVGIEIAARGQVLGKTNSIASALKFAFSREGRNFVTERVLPHNLVYVAPAPMNLNLLLGRQPSSATK